MSNGKKACNPPATITEKSSTERGEDDRIERPDRHGEGDGAVLSASTKQETTMTGKENYTRAIEFKGPAYLPCAIDVHLDYIHEKDEAKIERIRELAAQFPGDGLFLINPTCPGTKPHHDEWGHVWHGPQEGRPLWNGWEAAAGYVLPDPHRAGRFDAADGLLKRRGDRYVLPQVWFTLLERLWMLRGFENTLTDPYTDELSFCLLRDRIVEYDLAIIDQWIARKVPAVYFSDDWGSQRGLLMNPDDWRRFYKPSYRRLFDRVRSGGAHVWMHSCGDVTDIIPDLIDLGLNVLNPVQPQAMDVRRLSREFGGKVCFNGGVDVQGTLICGTPEEVKREVHDRVALFGRFNGGYIGNTIHCLMPETPLDNVIALLEAFAEYTATTEPAAPARGNIITTGMMWPARSTEP